MLETAQRAAIAIFRTMPRFRGRGTAARLVNGALLKLGADPLVCTRMRAGYRLRLDTRVQSMLRAGYEGEYDAGNLRAIKSFMRPGGWALDVGAQIGLWAVPFALHAREIGAKVAAFEPVPQNFAMLRHNVALNGLGETVALYDLALGDREDETQIALGWDFDGGGIVGNAVITENSPTFVNSARRIPIRRARFDQIWPGGRIDVVKVDIEGRETEFFEGARHMITRDRPAIIMEVCRGFYRDRGLDLEVMLPAVLPDYRVHKIAANGIEACEISAIPELTDALLLPKHK